MFLREFGLPPPVALPFNRDDFGMVREAVDQRDRTGSVGKDGVPVFEGKIRGDEEWAVRIAPTDDLEEEVGGVGVIGEVPDLIDGEQVGSGIVAQAPLEGAGGLLAVEIEHQIWRR